MSEPQALAFGSFMALDVFKVDSVANSDIQ